MSSGQASSGGRRWSIVLASREVWPFVEGGGIGRCMWAAARLLADHADVSVVTSSRWRERYEELVRAGDTRLPQGVRFAFADEPGGDRMPFVSWHHLWSLRLLEAAAALHPDGGPDILEVPDYQAEGFAAAHARRGLDPRLRNTKLVVRLSTSAEMCARLNEDPDDLHLRVLSGVERFPLRFADVLLWPGGNALERYAEMYGEDGLAPAIECPLPMADDLDVSSSAELPQTDGPLRLLYLNRLERRKGIVELVTAVRSLPEAELALTLVGRDTNTGPDGGSMRAHVEQLAAGDARIEVLDQVPHSDVPRLIAAHHAVVVPTRWETFSYVVREALACNRPVVATPAGGIIDVIRRGESGWLAGSSSPDDLAATLREALESRAVLGEMVAEGRPRKVFEEGSAAERNLAVYREIRAQPGPSAGGTTPARVEAVVACEPGGGDPVPTLLALERQRGTSVDAVVVADRLGRFPTGRALPLARTVVPAPERSGRPAAWAAGLASTSGDVVLLLAAGAVPGRDFVARAAAALRGEPVLAWVTSFVGLGPRPWDAPLGNYELPVEELDPTSFAALVRRSALEAVLADPASAPEDERQLIAELDKAGAYGLVLQERLLENVPRPR
jgi:glycosyltransferase involved in cell wall biosynthesis